MRHLGILAHSTEGAALCFRAFCQEGFAELGPYDHPDVTLDCISMARSMPAWEAGDHPAVRGTLLESAARLARAGADFFVRSDFGDQHVQRQRSGDEGPITPDGRDNAARSTTGYTRATHTVVRSRRSRGRRRAARYDAAARLRRRVDERGSGWCDWCLNDFPADAVEIDHVRPLSMGGTDTDGNGQVLCRGCHGLKTRTERGGATVGDYSWGTRLRRR